MEGENLTRVEGRGGGGGVKVKRGEVFRGGTGSTRRALGGKGGKMGPVGGIFLGGKESTWRVRRGGVGMGGAR